MSKKIEVVNLKPLICPTKVAAKYLGISESTLSKSRVNGTLLGVPTPPYKKIGKSVMYEIKELERWLEEMPSFRNTAEEALYSYD